MRTPRIAPFAVAALAACGGDAPGAGAERPAAEAGTTSAPAAPVDACGIVSEADLQQILGGPLDPAEPSQPIDAGGVAMRGCAWRTTDTSAGLSLQVRSGAQYRPDASAFERYAEGFEANMGTRPEVQPLTGLGSAALWDATNHVLLVRAAKPGYELSVQPYLSRRVPMVGVDQARAMAEAVLAKLP